MYKFWISNKNRSKWVLTTVNFYIEELKSDNASLKLNAATKIPVIAAVLGHNRIRD